MEFVVRERKRMAICTCRRTKNAPLCDGSHLKP
ncbi:MAG: CDGSH iron-sulfur domain-containing protein [bacterium]